MERVELLNISVEDLSNRSFIDAQILNDLLVDKIDIRDLDDFDLKLLTNALGCEPEYFFDEKVRNKDLLKSSFNRGDDDIKSINVKLDLQRFIKNYNFVREIYNGLGVR